MDCNSREEICTVQAFDNSGNYIDLPTHYNWPNYGDDLNADPRKHIAGQVTHPDVLKVEDGFGGHKYWMIYTPNVMLTSQFENPYIVFSDDGKHWAEPVKEGKSINPIVQRVCTAGNGENAHNCDTDMVYDEKNKRILAYWNWAADSPKGGKGCEVRMKVSYDGIHWGIPIDAKQEVEEGKYLTVLKDEDVRYNFLSPTVTYDNKKEVYMMYYTNTGDAGYTNGQKNKVQMRQSENGITWSDEVKDVNNFLATTESGEQLAPWHQDIQYIQSLDEYWALAQCFAGDSPDNTVLYMSKSKDGLNWKQVGKRPVLLPHTAPFWNDFQIYRATFLFDEETNKMGIWYSALQTTPENKIVQDSQGNYTIPTGTDDSRIWRIGYTENDIDVALKILLEHK